MSNMKEIWKEIREWEGAYQASNTGKIRSIDRYVTWKNGRKSFKRGRQLTGRIDKYGYPYVVLSFNGRRKTYKSHRLIASTFIPNPDGKPQVNHINGVKTDNNITNLEWCTASENSLHSHKTGLVKSRKGIPCKVKNKLTNDEYSEIIEKLSSNYEYGDFVKIAKEYGVSAPSIRRIFTFYINSSGGNKHRYHNSQQKS